MSLNTSTFLDRHSTWTRAWLSLWIALTWQPRFVARIWSERQLAFIGLASTSHGVCAYSWLIPTILSNARDWCMLQVSRSVVYFIACAISIVASSSLRKQQAPYAGKVICGDLHICHVERVIDSCMFRKCDFDQWKHQRSRRMLTINTCLDASLVSHGWKPCRRCWPWFSTVESTCVRCIVCFDFACSWSHAWCFAERNEFSCLGHFATYWCHQCMLFSSTRQFWIRAYIEWQSRVQATTCRIGGARAQPKRTFVWVWLLDMFWSSIVMCTWKSWRFAFFTFGFAM